MAEKIYFMIFSKFLEKILELGLKSFNTDNKQVSLMASYRIVMKHQADNAIAMIDRRGVLHNNMYLKFTLPGCLTEQQESELMRYVEQYITINVDPWDAEHIVYTWSSHDPVMSQKKPKFTKKLRLIRPRKYL